MDIYARIPTQVFTISYLLRRDLQKFKLTRYSFLFPLERCRRAIQKHLLRSDSGGAFRLNVFKLTRCLHLAGKFILRAVAKIKLLLAKEAY